MVLLNKLNLLLSYFFICLVTLDISLTALAISSGLFSELNTFDLYLWNLLGLPIGSLIHFCILFMLYFFLFIFSIAIKEESGQYALLTFNIYLLSKWLFAVSYNAYYLIFYH